MADSGPPQCGLFHAGADSPAAFKASCNCRAPKGGYLVSFIMRARPRSSPPLDSCPRNDAFQPALFMASANSRPNDVPSETPTKASMFTCCGGNRFKAFFIAVLCSGDRCLGWIFSCNANRLRSASAALACCLAISVLAFATSCSNPATSLFSLAARSSMFAISCPDNCDVRTVPNNSPAIPKMRIIRDSRASFFSVFSLFGRDVNSATNSPTQPRNTIAVETYSNHSQQPKADFSDATSESVRIILDHKKREERTLLFVLLEHLAV